MQLERFYARQSRLIDSGDATGWAATFATDGEFHSPSYPEPVVGTAALTAFAERFHAAGRETGVVSRHVVTNVDLEPGADADHATGHAYLQIVATARGEESRLVRLTVITDQLVRSAGGDWLVQRRQVVRDDA